MGVLAGVPIYVPAWSTTLEISGGGLLVLAGVYLYGLLVKEAYLGWHNRNVSNTDLNS